MNIKQKNITQDLVREVEVRMQEQFAHNPSALVTTLEQFILTGGKRIRPTITLLMGKLFAVEHDTLLNLAAAIEMLHTATLVHDDLVDEAPLRRGKKTLNASFPTSATVLAGDLAFAAAAQLATATDSISVMRKFSEVLQFIVNGEITYMFSNGASANQDAYYRWIHAKTASVFELAAGMAAELGSDDTDEIEAAYQFGYSIGMAFQIIDDMLDFIGDPEIMGKPTGNDLRQGTLTLPTLYYLEAHPDDPDLSSIIRRNGHSQDSIERVITAIRQSEAIEQARQEAQRFWQEGLQALARLPETPERFELERVAHQIINRNM